LNRKRRRKKMMKAKLTMVMMMMEEEEERTCVDEDTFSIHLLYCYFYDRRKEKRKK
jgi:hypothetical protein